MPFQMGFDENLFHLGNLFFLESSKTHFYIHFVVASKIGAKKNFAPKFENKLC